ncbi:MAG: cytochrome c maturation protein CcmE [Acidimicrobiales bacterium]|nr:cytochrome c maturation protein CcmE [Acidimicrobiales bacterium]
MTDTDAPTVDPNADAPLDLTPRRVTTSRRGPKWLPGLVLVVVAAGVIGLIFSVLSGASLFFYNVDEAVAKRADLGEDRFRMQGTPVGDRFVDTELDGQTAVAFSVAFDGVEADVVHVGDPAELFQPGVPVVLEGVWRQGPAPVGRFVDGANDGWWFESNRMLVKHDADYTEDNAERLREAERGGSVEIITPAP